MMKTKMDATARTDVRAARELRRGKTTDMRIAGWN